MASEKLRIVSFNANGILNPVKHSRIRRREHVFTFRRYTDDIEHELLFFFLVQCNNN